MSIRRSETTDFERCVEFYRHPKHAKLSPRLALWLQLNPELAERARQHAAIEHKLQHLYAPVLDEPIPFRLRAGRQSVRSHWPVGLSAAAALMFAISAGWWLQTLSSGKSTAKPAFSQLIADLAQDEVSPASRSDTREALPVTYPDLSAQGYTLISHRVVSDAGEPLVEFRYGNRQGAQIRIYANEYPEEVTETPRILSDDGVTQAHWRDNNVDYALVGNLPDHSLYTLAQAVALSIPNELPGQPPVQRQQMHKSLSNPARPPNQQSAPSAGTPSQASAM